MSRSATACIRLGGASQVARQDPSCKTPINRQGATSRGSTVTRPQRLPSHPGVTKPHHAVTEQGVVLGYSHQGMLTAARGILRQLVPAKGPSLLKAALASGGGHLKLRVVGAWALAHPQLSYDSNGA